MTGQEAVERIHQEAWIGREPGLSRITKLLDRKSTRLNSSHRT